jgi:hypothetical protein
MELEIATLEDIINELRRRAIQFVLVGVEPTNLKDSTIRIGAFAKDAREVRRLLGLGRDVIRGESEDRGSGDGCTDED